MSVWAADWTWSGIRETASNNSLRPVVHCKQMWSPGYTAFSIATDQDDSFSIGHATSTSVGRADPRSTKGEVSSTWRLGSTCRLVVFEDLMFLECHLAKSQRPNFPGCLRKEQPSPWGMEASMLHGLIALPWNKSICFLKINLGLGKPYPTKTDDFLEKFQKGEG